MRRLLVGSEKLVLDAASSTVQFKQPGVEINLGSIGKGYALDVVSKHFKRENEPALLSAGASSFLATGSTVPGLLVFVIRVQTETTRKCSTARVCDVDEWK